MLSHFKSAEYACKKKLVKVSNSAHRLPHVMWSSTQSFIARHSKSILTVSNEMMRQSMVRMPRRPCTEPIARLVR